MRVRIGRFYSGAPEAIGVHAELDIPLLVEDGAFIQAGSGYGKTTLLVEVVEQTHQHIQQIIIDPEGEFSPLRANHDFVIAAAQNGDALAHPRTAGLLATRLLETKASAILDIYDLKPRERPEFVMEFINSMMNAPKDLWHPVLVILDEAHLFCPEKGFGEAVSADAVEDLAGRGRKRGFRLVAATQRIAKFSKTAAAELHTKFIGHASIDDMKRVAFELSLTPKEAVTKIRKLNPGEFYAYGRAIGIKDEPCLFRSDIPQTKLSKAGKRKLSAPPKPTDKIRALLPQLADIPKEVEQKAKTEEQLRKDLSDARRKIEGLELELKRPIVPAPSEKGMKTMKKVMEISAKLKRLETALGKLMKFVVTINTTETKLDSKVVQSALESAVAQVSAAITARIDKAQKELVSVQERGKKLIDEIEKLMKEELRIDLNVVKVPEVVISGTPAKIQLKIPQAKADIADSDLTQPEQRILNAIAWMSVATNNETVTQVAAAFLANYTPGSSSFRNPRSALASKGYLEYSGTDIKLTKEGSLLARFPQTRPTGAEIRAHVVALLDGPERRLLEKLIDVYPAKLTQEEHAILCNYAPGSSSYRNPRSHLASLELLDYQKPDSVIASKWLFLE